MSSVSSLQLGPYSVPKGTEVNINITAVHHDERWWQDAEAFKPERWMGDPTGGDKSGGLAYLPFGSGPKFCAGYKLARKAAQTCSLSQYLHQVLSHCLLQLYVSCTMHVC